MQTAYESKSVALHASYYDYERQDRASAIVSRIYKQTHSVGYSTTSCYTAVWTSACLERHLKRLPLLVQPMLPIVLDLHAQ